MSTPKTTFYLTNGTKLVDVYPLESNGPVTTGDIPNQSIPNEIVDIDYFSNTVTVFGDLTARLNSFTSTKVSGPSASNVLTVATPAEFNTLIAAGLAVGMFIDVPLTPAELATVPQPLSPVSTRTSIVEINYVSRTLILSNALTRAVTSSRTVRFCFPFNIIDLNPMTPSPYVGAYGVRSCLFNNNVSAITLCDATPLQPASFDIVQVAPGTNGTWTLQGLTNAHEVFYPSSSFTISGNSQPAANVSYQVASTAQSQPVVIKQISVSSGSTETAIIVEGNVGAFFIDSTVKYPQFTDLPSSGEVGKVYLTTDTGNKYRWVVATYVQTVEPTNQLRVSSNTTHNTGSHPLNGVHDINYVELYNSVDDTTTIHINTVISNTPPGVSQPANGYTEPAIPTSIITVNGFIVSNAQSNGVLHAGAPIQLPFSAPPAITPTTPHNYIVSWRVAGDYTLIFTPGHTVTIKNNNYYSLKKLVVSSVNYDGTTTEIRTNITDPGSTTPTIGQSGSIIFPAMAVPFGHIQYSVLVPATPLELVGRGVTHYNSQTTWGQALQDNAIHQLENFANDTPPVAPLEGQYWFNPSVPSMNVRVNDDWQSVVVEGMPVQGDILMNDHAIVQLANTDPTNPDPTQALNVHSADYRYVNVIGDTMTGILAMSNHKITNVGDTEIPTGTTVDLSNVHGQDALNLRTGDARYVNVDGDTMLADLSMGQNRITSVLDPLQSQDAATKAYVDSLSSGIVWLHPILDPNLFDDSLSAPPPIADSAMLFYRSYYVKPHQYNVSGLNDALKIWSVDDDYSTTFLAGHTFELTGNTEPLANKTYTVVSATYSVPENQTHITVSESFPPTSAIDGVIYHAGGQWNTLAGRIAGWSGTQWVDVLERKVQPGDKFGVFFEVDNDEASVPVPGGSFAVGTPLGTATKSAAGKIVTVNAVSADYSIDWGTGTTPQYPPQVPVEPDAVSVLGVNSLHYGHSYTFRGIWSQGDYSIDYKWIEFAGPSMLVDGAGLKYTGNILNVGQGTGITVTANTVGVNTSYLNTNYMRRDGSTAFTGNISMGNHLLHYLSDPISPLDAVNLQFLTANFMSLSGLSAMTGNLDMNGFNINNLAAPSLPGDAVTKSYADSMVSAAGDTMTGALSMSSATGTAYIDMGTTNRIVNLANPVSAMDAVNLQTADGRYVNIPGDTMTGFLTLHAAPTQNMHASTKKYVDDQIVAAVSTVQSDPIDGGAF